MKIALFTLTKNRFSYTKRTFQSLAKKTHIPYDHFVIDQGSKDKTVKWLNEFHNQLGKVYVYPLAMNIGINRGVNFAIDKIGDKADVVIKIDNDVKIETDGWLEKCLKVLKPKLLISPYVKGLIDNRGGVNRVGYIPEANIGLTPFIGGICLPKGSNVLATPESKNIEKLKIGDRVLSSKGTYQKIINTTKRYYNGRLIKIKCRNLPELELTLEHPVLVSGEELKWVKAKDLRKNDLLVFPKLKSFTSIKKIDLANYVKNSYYSKRSNNGKRTHMLKYKIGKKYITSKNGSSYSLPRFIEFNEAFFRLCGWYLAEGSSMSKQKGIVFTLNGVSSEAEKVNILLKSVFNKKGKVYKLKGNAVGLRFYSRILYSFFNKEFRKGARNKIIPPFIINSSRKLLDSFLESYIDGDGYRRKAKNETVIVTASEKIMWALIMIYSKLNMLPSFYQRQVELNGKKFKQYVISVCINKKRKGYFENKDNFFVPIKNLESRDYKGYVYNIETKDNTYAVPIIIHNCMIGLRRAWKEDSGGWEYPVPKHAGGDKSFCGKLSLSGYRFGYKEDVVIKHIDDTLGQIERYKNYFEKRKTERSIIL